MATYIALVSFTDEGIGTVKESPKRFAKFKAMAEKLGATVQSFYYTVSPYDMVLTIEGSDEAVVTALLKQGSLGTIRTQTMRAFSVAEMEQMVAHMP